MTTTDALASAKANVSSFSFTIDANAGQHLTESPLCKTNPSKCCATVAHKLPPP